MKVRTTGDVEEYAAAVTAFLEAEPCARNVLRWVIDLVRAGNASTDPPSFWWIEDARAVAGAAHLTPPYPLLVSSLPRGAASPLAFAVRERAAALGTTVHGVNGPRDTAEAVAVAWTAATGAAHHLQHTLLLHELETYVDVPPPRGHRRAGTIAELDLVTRWFEAFAAETELIKPGVDQRRAASLMLQQGDVELWEVDDAPVSLTGHRGPAAGVVRVGPVYTPPEQRNHGYARRLVAEVTAVELARPGVRRCMLFTDIANPVSNAIYRQIGYVPTGEHVEIAFG
jgi:predicted GNAT family acetyltransferase